MASIEQFEVLKSWKVAMNAVVPIEWILANIDLPQKPINPWKAHVSHDSKRRLLRQFALVRPWTTLGKGNRVTKTLTTFTANADFCGCLFSTDFCGRSFSREAICVSLHQCVLPLQSVLSIQLCFITKSSRNWNVNPAEPLPATITREVKIASGKIALAN